MLSSMTNTPAFGFANQPYYLSTFGQITGTLGSGVGNVNGVGGPRVLAGGGEDYVLRVHSGLGKERIWGAPRRFVWVALSFR